MILKNKIFQDTFVHCLDGVISESKCEEYIDRFEPILSNNKDLSVAYRDELFLQEHYKRNDQSWIVYPNFEYFHEVEQVVWKESEKYLRHYELYPPHHVIETWKYHIVCPYQGFHQFHHERGYKDHKRRLTWMIYLNEVREDEGTTEFFHQHIKVKPKPGRMLIWPAEFTHKHRGNPMYTDVKHYITGWILCKEWTKEDGK